MQAKFGSDAKHNARNAGGQLVAVSKGTRLNENSLEDINETGREQSYENRTQDGSPGQSMYNSAGSN